ncbi:hypothetical protein [Skermania piniformis]|uniref:Uncharacterized protein n=1 Tax=Skermania pinensis TaxID=39122 RepID=A0ABX8S7E8_9ACTN|nr:hypothetical protein [Skermania piniformis]QXQ13763.1 hypothetical protein KV203_18580 [Skermania piniformis]
MLPDPPDAATGTLGKFLAESCIEHSVTERPTVAALKIDDNMLITVALLSGHGCNELPNYPE